MISEKYNYMKKEDVLKNTKDLEDFGYITYRNNFLIFKLGKSVNQIPERKKMISRLSKAAESLGASLPNLDETSGNYFVVRIDGNPVDAHLRTAPREGENPYKNCFFSEIEDVLKVLPEGLDKVYPPQFFKYLTEREDWDVQPEELYWDENRMEELYKDFLKEIDDTVKKLEKLKKDGKEDTPEFASFIITLDDLAPELARSFKAS